ncbi:hypothetical protein F5Y07DRAFT_377252 [Xylaria sp. FL0933]|nr:hypothetical protein F5Y07DRAFT_377252 [Xylaria sp. FL0933]
MFGGSRRRRPPATPLNSATANPNATTAAASAFMSAVNQNPNKALSSAAAAAALRARPHTPTNVAEVQTKRTARRSTSVSSSGSARLANGHGRLERRGSSASMTERTFRSPSPHRTAAPGTHEPEPPVPRIPDGHKDSAAATPRSRAAGVGMQTFRTASQKMADEHPSWHVQPAGDVSNVRTSDSIMRPANSVQPRANAVASPPARSDSRNSINFSYPTTFRPQSPPTSPTSPASPASVSKRDSKVASNRPPTSALSSPSKGPPPAAGAQTGRQLVYDPNSRRMVPKAQVEEAVEFQIRQAAEKPPKRRRDGNLQREGSQLAKGTVARTRGTIVDENKSLRESTKREQPTTEVLSTAEERPREEASKAKSVVTTEIPVDQTSPTQSPESMWSICQSSTPLTREAMSEQGSDVRPESHSALNPVETVQDKPPVNAGKSGTSDRSSEPSQTVRDVLDSMPTRQVLFEESQSPQPSQTPDHGEPTEESRPSATIEDSASPEVHGEQKVMVPENRPIVGLAAEKGDLRRSNSNSPARQARFAPEPAEKLAVKHTPLSRSASPIKSAMKRTSSVQRETSPSDNASDPSRSGTVSPDRKDEPAASRKKSVRVSFDDQGTVVVGDSTPAGEDSQATPSPQGHKRAWFSNIGRSKKKEIALDDDEIMKPRPALPSFGSIREKKIREQGERTLVRPLEPAYSPAIPSSPELRPQSASTLNESETTEDPPLGQSSDQAIGALLVQDQASRNAANISRFREPLPPVVTSIEGSGYSSDSTQDSDYIEHTDSTAQGETPQLTQPDVQDSSSQSTPTLIDSSRGKSEERREVMTVLEQDVPQISVIQPSPMSAEHNSRAAGSATPQYFDVPGGFPDSVSDTSGDSQVEAPKDDNSGTIFEPAIAAVESGQAEHLPQTTLSTTTPVASLDDNITDESDESVYSDAYEDIPDLDSSGFMSLDAIVESPINEESKQKIPKVPENLPTAIITSESRHDVPSKDGLPSQEQPKPPRDANDWEQAKAFWRSLTAEKRRQLELEAAEEAGADGDGEEASQPVRRNSSRRKTSEPKQLALQVSPVHDKAKQPPSHMRTSLRDHQPTKAPSAQSQTGMRKTMRSNGGAQNVAKPSTRQTIPAKTPTAKSSMSGGYQAGKDQSHAATQPIADSPSATTQAKPVLQRRGSDDSDSSFKRSRPSASGTSAFRKTMRQGSFTQPRHESTGGSGRFSLRSLSPAGSTARSEQHGSFATSSPGGMKRTLRSNSESSHEGKRSSVHFPLFGRSTKSAPKSSKFTSRFDDSSDEDEGAFARFRSRLEDSSDEEETRPPSSRGSKSLGKTTLRSSATAPSISRPAPVPEVEEDSPDLPDSDDDDDPMPSLLNTPQSRVATSDFATRLAPARQSSGAIGTSTLGRSRSGRGAFTSSVTSPALPAKDKRGSFMSRLRLNRRADQSGKIQREIVDSAARRDTKLERDPGQLKELRGEQPSSPKLQKRTSMGRSENGDLQRPTSAGNLFSRSATTGTLERPLFHNKRSFSLGTNPNNESHDYENASVDNPSVLKKKKFGALRRMFRLDE